MGDLAVLCVTWLGGSYMKSPMSVLPALFIFFALTIQTSQSQARYNSVAAYGEDDDYDRVGRESCDPRYDDCGEEEDDRARDDSRDDSRDDDREEGRGPSANARHISGGSVQIGGRTISCRQAREIILDEEAPGVALTLVNEGVIVINPSFLQEHPKEVQWFIFYHECGHLNDTTAGKTGELRADAYGLRVAQREGWLTGRVLQDICDSFHNAPESRDHPSGARRCQADEAVFRQLQGSH